MRPRLYLDEDVIPDLAPILRSHGYDAVSCHEIGARRLSDEEQLARAALDGRVMLSLNYHDFPNITRQWLLAGRSHAGIVVSYHRYTKDELGQLVRTVEAMLHALTAEDLQNTLRILDDFR